MRGKRGIRVFMLSPHGRMSPFQPAQMYSLAGPQHPQPRDRRRVRRLPGHREGGQRRRRVQGALRGSARSTRSTGRASPRRSSTTSRATSRVTRGDGEPVDFAVPSGNFGNILAGHVARADGAADPPADPRHQRERRARRVLPHRALPAARHRRDARDVEPVDGHLQGVELRALRVRPRRPRSRGGARAVGALDAEGGFDLAGTPHCRARRRIGLRLGDEHARRSARDDPRRRTRSTASSSIRTPPTASRSGSSTASRGVPLVCLETALPAKFAATIREALGRDPARPAAYADLEPRPQRCERAARRRRAVKAYIAAHAERPPDAPRASSSAAPSPRSLPDAPRARQARPATWSPGVRLALFLPVSRLAFRIDLAQLLLLFAVSALIDFGVRLGPLRPRRATSRGSAPATSSSAPACCCSRRRCSRSRSGSARSRCALPVLLLAGFPLLQVLRCVPGAAALDATPPEIVGACSRR